MGHAQPETSPHSRHQLHTSIAQPETGPHSCHRLHTRTTQPENSPPVTHTYHTARNKSTLTSSVTCTAQPETGAHSRHQLHTRTANAGTTPSFHSLADVQIIRPDRSSLNIPAYQHTSSSLRPTLSNKHASYTQINTIK